MRHAIHLPPFGPFGDVGFLVELAQEAEEIGWDGFFLWDHILYADDVDLVDPWIAMAAVACHTSTVRLGPLVTPIPRRRPWHLAREAVTLDHLSGGRLTLGVGLGVDFWREYSAFDEPAVDDRIRAEYTDDGITILRGLWSGERFSHQGRRSSVTDARFLPAPVQSPTIPIWSAALWPVGPGPRRRAAGCEGIMPVDPTGPIAPAEIASLRADLGVGPDFDICLHGPPTLADDYRDAGVSWFCLSFGPETPRDEARAQIQAGPPR